MQLIEAERARETESCGGGNRYIITTRPSMPPELRMGAERCCLVEREVKLECPSHHNGFCIYGLSNLVAKSFVAKHKFLFYISLHC